MSLLEAAVSATPGSEDRMRAHQLMRGTVSNKRVASKKALTSLESVAISDLPKTERSKSYTSHIDLLATNNDV